MNGSALAALALAAALTVCSPRHRLRSGRSSGRRFRIRLARFALAGCALGCAVATAFGLLRPAGFLAATTLCATVLLRRRRRARRGRAIAEGAAVATALDVLVGELRVGAHPVRAFGEAATETEQVAVAAGLRAVAARARLGADVPAGLRSVAASSSLPAHWQRLAVYWQLGNDHGLPTSTLMQAAQRDIVAQQRFSRQVESGMAGARASANILAGLPVLGVLLGQLIGAQPVRFLCDRGAGLLLVGVLLVCAGLLWSDRITGRRR